MKKKYDNESVEFGFKCGYEKRGEDILKLIRGYICGFAPTINFRDWLIKKIKEQEQ